MSFTVIKGCLGTDLTIVVFKQDGKTSWATNTSCGDGSAPTTIASFFPNGALCGIIALFMANIQYFQEKGIHTPFALCQALRDVVNVSHGQLEQKDMTSIANHFNVTFLVTNTHPEIQPDFVCGDNDTKEINGIVIDLTNGHYVVPHIDGPLKIVKSKQKECDACTYLNVATATNCAICGNGFGDNRPINMLG